MPQKLENMKKIVLFLITAAIISGCQNMKSEENRKKLAEEIYTLEKKLLETKDASKDKQSALMLIEKTKLYAKNFPSDSLSPILLFKAGDVAKGAREYGKAIHLWGLVWRNYENHPKSPMALFLQGFTFDSDLRDPKMASKYYNDFLTKYPDNPLAEQVKQLLAVVEVNPDELIKQFEGQ